MTKIICPCDDCIHNGKEEKGYVCQCKEISLIFRNMNTVNEGRQNLWVCKKYEMSEELKELEEHLKRYWESRGV